MKIFNEIKEVDIGPFEKLRPNINQILENFTGGFENLIEKYFLDLESSDRELQRFFDFCRNYNKPLRFHDYLVEFDSPDSKNFFGCQMSITPDAKQPCQFGFDHCDEHPFYMTKTNNAKSQQWLKFNNFHNENGPAVIDDYGNLQTKIWFFVFGFKHRENAPAVKLLSIKDDTKYFREDYYQFNKYHREDGPAYIDFYPVVDHIYRIYNWYKFGKMHNENGPTVVERRGSDIKKMYFYQFGYKHREDGPAEYIVLSNRTVKVRYFLFGIHFTKKAFDLHISNMSKFGASAKRDYIYDKFKIKHGMFITEEYEEYRKEFYSFGLLHREDGPASIVIARKNTGQRVLSVTKKWYKFGQHHRIGGPASLNYIFDSYGKINQVKKIWYRFNHRHREDGPAYEKRVYEDNLNFYRYQYFLFGKCHRDNRPARIEIHQVKSTGRIKKLSLHFYQFDVLHRDNGPAIIKYLGRTQLKFTWYSFGVLHREDGPAVMIFSHISTSHKLRVESRYCVLNKLLNFIGPEITIHYLDSNTGDIKIGTRYYSKINSGFSDSELSEISNSYLALHKAGFNVFDAPNIHLLNVFKDLAQEAINSSEEIL